MDDWVERSGYAQSTTDQTTTKNADQPNSRSETPSAPSNSPTPTSWVGLLTSILTLEEERGFNNTSVVGGVDRFIQRWAQTIAEDMGDSGVHRVLPKIPYTDLTQEERSWWVEQWRALIARHQDAEGSPSEVSVRFTQPASSDSHPTRSPDARLRSTEAQPTAGTHEALQIPRTVVPSARETAPENQPRPDSQPAYRKPPEGLTVDAPVNRLRGVDDKLIAGFKRLDVYTIRDLLHLFPRRHLDYSKIVQISDLVPGELCTVVGTVWEARNLKGGPADRRTDTEAVISDETGDIQVRWFGQRHLAQTLRPNRRVGISGKTYVHDGQITFDSPDYELPDQDGKLIHTGRLVPVYPHIQGMDGRTLRRITWQALQEWVGGIEEPLPEGVLYRANLTPIQDAIMHIHYPDSPEQWEKARQRLAFDELFTLQLAVLSRKRHKNVDVEGVSIQVNREVFRGFFGSLPFPLTGAQRRCIREILKDLKRGTPPMNRLLQGEVGSGKTVVALAALLATAASGLQGAIMTPTEVLARQHFDTISRLLSGPAKPVEQDFLIAVYLESLGRQVSVGLLTGSTRRSARQELIKMADAGNLDILVGTQPLIQSVAPMPNLVLAVVDEQRQPGALPKSKLYNQGKQTPHILTILSSQIPSTLSLTLYGDLDISTLDELPAGRQEVATRWVSPERRPAAYAFVHNQIQEGRQGLVICPIAEESASIKSRAATREYEYLSKHVFPDLRVGLLHGKMTVRARIDQLNRVQKGEIDILVSTANAIAGIDTTNASVAIIEEADAFPLAEIHKLRGRVGRNTAKSYCLLLSDSPSEAARERLNALETIHDGFKLAEVDLELCGTEDIFGARRAGFQTPRMAKLSDRGLLQLARKEAISLLEPDSDLTNSEHYR